MIMTTATDKGGRAAAGVDASVADAPASKI
jgi:hypothetical protein